MDYDLGQLVATYGADSPQTRNFIKTTLESTQLQTLDDGLLVFINGVRFLRTMFQTACDKFLTRSLLITAVLIGAHIIILLFIIFALISFYLMRLDNEYSKLRALMVMIPNDIMNKNRQFR